MPVERIIAIDFGTSTSVVRVKRYQNGQPVGDRLETKPVTFNMGNTVVPTLIQKRDTQETLYFGYDAEIPHRNTVICRNFKVEIESPDPGVRDRARGLTAEFFDYLFKTYQEQSLGGHLGESSDKKRTIISYPVKWSKETKAFMLEAARNAGFPNVEGQDEAQAAIQAVTVQSAQQLREKGYFVAGMPVNILLIDMGAGTTDLVLCRHTPGDRPQTEILSTWPHGVGNLFGGREVDELLRNYIKSLLPVEDAEKILKKLGADKFKAWKEHEVSPALARGETVDYFSALDDRLEDLEIDMDYAIDRQTFEDFAQGYLQGLPELINGCLHEAGVNENEVDLVVVTGGHSQWYFVQEILSGRLERFGSVKLGKIRSDPSRIVSTVRPHETVALGMVYSPLRATLPKPESKPAQETPKVIPPMPPVLHTSRLVRPDRPIRPTLPKKDSNIDEIRAFYRNNRSAIAFASSLDKLCCIQLDGTIAIERNAWNLEIWKWNNIVSIINKRIYGSFAASESPFFAMGLKSNGTVECTAQSLSEWRGIASMDCVRVKMGPCPMGVRSKGTVITARPFRPLSLLWKLDDGWVDEVEGWVDIVSISCGDLYTVGLQSSGTVVAAGDNRAGQCNVENWCDIVSIACGLRHTVGLRSDGTAVATGDNDCGQCNVQDWQDITSIICGDQHTVGLRSDGTVVAVGDNKFGQCNVQDWKNVLSIAASGSTGAILNDGTVIQTACTIIGGCIYCPRPTKVLPFIAIQEISKEYQRQKTSQRSPKDGRGRKPRQSHAEAGVIT